MSRLEFKIHFNRTLRRGGVRNLRLELGCKVRMAFSGLVAGVWGTGDPGSSLGSNSKFRVKFRDCGFGFRVWRWGFSSSTFSLLSTSHAPGRHVHTKVLPTHCVLVFRAFV